MIGGGVSPVPVICGYALIGIAVVCNGYWIACTIISIVHRCRRGPAWIPPPVPPLDPDGEPLDRGEHCILAGLAEDLRHADPEPEPVAGMAWWPFWRADGGPR